MLTFTKDSSENDIYGCEFKDQRRNFFKSKPIPVAQSKTLTG